MCVISNQQKLCRSTPDAIVGNPRVILIDSLSSLLEKVYGLEPMVRDDAQMQSFKKIKLKASNLVTVNKKYFPRCFEIAHSLFKISSKLKNSHIPVYMSLRSALQKAYPNATLHGIARSTVYRHNCNSDKKLYIKGWSL